MTVAKITISLSDEALRKARAAVAAGDAASVSAYIAAAVDEKRGRDDLRAMLVELAEEAGGPLTRAERAQARRDLGLASRRRRR
jgi:Arc/MetJ-type ribon-helix-helix transcriptional regulator